MSHSPDPAGRITRRRLLEGAALGSAGLAAAATLGTSGWRADASPRPFVPPLGNEQITLPPTTFAGYHSPPTRPYVDPLPIPHRRPLGGTMVIAEKPYRFHRDLPLARSWGFDGVPHLGPTLEARSGEDIVTVFENRLGLHAARELIDRSLHGVSELDRTKPPVIIHLHGAPNRPIDDGYPMASFRPGEKASYRFGNDLPATALWYHDHSMGNTRLNVYLGLAGQYWVRDSYDTGRADNPLGLPSGAQEIPLTICDKLFYPNGMARYNSTPTEVARGHWGGGLCGDRMVVNGKVWPYLNVDRGIYRFRVLSASQLNDYRVSFSNRMPFWVIGSDGGLLDRPAWVEAFDLAPSERYDILVDFGQLRPGESVELRNTEQISWAGQAPGGAMIPQIMRFTATSKTAPVTEVPATLRGSHHHQPALLPRVEKPTVPDAQHTLNVNLSADGGGTSLLMMNLDNTGFDSPHVDTAVQGTVQRWNLINTDMTTQVHAIHIHLVQFRVLGRQNYNQPKYLIDKQVPFVKDDRWAPSADDYVYGPVQKPAPYEVGWKDTVRCPPGMITRILIRWPTADELGFDPDKPFRDIGGMTEQGYIWHCHMMDHEDNEMMHRLRVVDPTNPRPQVPLPAMPARAIELVPGVGVPDPRDQGHGHGGTGHGGAGQGGHQQTDHGDMGMGGMAH